MNELETTIYEARHDPDPRLRLRLHAAMYRDIAAALRRDITALEQARSRDVRRMMRSLSQAESYERLAQLFEHEAGR